MNITMKMNSDDKFNAFIAYKTSALLIWSDLKSLIVVDLSASAAAFAPSLLSDLPRVFNSSGRPGISSASIGHAVRAAARLFRQFGR